MDEVLSFLCKKTKKVATKSFKFAKEDIEQSMINKIMNNEITS